jgi:hypothetical protein
VFRELLGVDIQMASHVYNAIGRQYAPESLKDIPGMTADLLAKIHGVFILPEMPEDPVQQ